MKQSLEYSAGVRWSETPDKSTQAGCSGESSTSSRRVSPSPESIESYSPDKETPSESDMPFLARYTDSAGRSGRFWSPLSSDGYPREHYVKVLARGSISWLASNVLLTITLLAGLVVIVICIVKTVRWFKDPDHAALPWREYCSEGYPRIFAMQESSHGLELQARPEGHHLWPTVHEWSNATEPVSLFIGVFTYDAAISRRHLIRETYAFTTPSTVRYMFIMGRPRAKLAQAIDLEMEAFGDIAILDMKENMNDGKTAAFFSWAEENATVNGVKAQYVAKADDDSFIILAELEHQLRALPRQMAFWGYMIRNEFLAGECYVLTSDLVAYVAGIADKRVVGAEDVVTSSWIQSHPRREDIVWINERCWVYDHPRAQSVYARGFFFPAEWQRATTFRQDRIIRDDAYSSVSRWGSVYTSPIRGLSAEERIEAMVEGSEMSLLRNDKRLYRSSVVNPYTRQRVDKAMEASIPRARGTIIVHWVKRDSWWLETMAAFDGVLREIEREIQDDWREVDVSLAA